MYNDMTRADGKSSEMGYSVNYIFSARSPRSTIYRLPCPPRCCCCCLLLPAHTLPISAIVVSAAPRQYYTPHSHKLGPVEYTGHRRTYDAMYETATTRGGNIQSLCLPMPIHMYVRRRLPFAHSIPSRGPPFHPAPTSNPLPHIYYIKWSFRTRSGTCMLYCCIFFDKYSIRVLRPWLKPYYTIYIYMMVYLRYFVIYMILNIYVFLHIL